MSNYRCPLIILALVPLAWGQPPTATSSPSGTTQPSTTSKPRIDSVRTVDPGNIYHRVYARVPLIGKGTPDDPKRPMFAPTTPSKDHSGILGYAMQVSDDGHWALCEFFGATPADLKIITTSANPDVVFFERGHATMDQVVAEFSKCKKNFSLAGTPAAAGVQ